MLDVLHYFFEEDYRTPTHESALRLSAVRESVYQSLYDMDYPYAMANDSTNSPSNAFKYDPADFADDEEFDNAQQMSGVKAFNPSARPYTPATEPKYDNPKPFGDILDSPLR